MKMSAPPLQPNNFTSISVSAYAYAYAYQHIRPSWKPLNLVLRRMGNLSNKYSKDESLFKCSLYVHSLLPKDRLFTYFKVRLSGSTNSAGN